MPELLRSRFWGAHLLAVLAVAATIALGVWQWHVWGVHRDAKAHDLSNAAPVALSSLMGGDDPFPANAVGRPVRFTGAWMPSATTYVAGHRYDGRSGYRVMTPVRVDRTGSAMPVVWGWSATTSAPEPRGTVTVTGWLQASEDTGAVDHDPSDDVIPELRIASLVQRVPVDLYSGYVVQHTATSAAAGTTPVRPAAVPDVSSTESLRNLLYAFQWWVFSLLAVYMWWRWCEFQLHPPDDEDAGADPEASTDPEPEQPAPDGQVPSTL